MRMTGGDVFGIVFSVVAIAWCAFIRGTFVGRRWERERRVEGQSYLPPVDG